MTRHLGFAFAATLTVAGWGCVSSSTDPAPFSLPDASFGAGLVVSGGPTLDLGAANCGDETAKSATFTLKNEGASAVTFQTSLTSTDVFAVSPASGTVEAGATVTVTVSAKPVPSTEAAGQVDQATVTVTSDSAALPSASIALKRTATGATFTLSPANVAFGDVATQTTSAPVTLTLKNAGNAAADVKVGTPTNSVFAIAGGGTATTVAPGAALPSLSATFSPTAAGSLAASAPITVTGPVCGASVTSIPLSGTGIAGAASVTPGTLDFGLVSCGTQGAAQNVKVGNAGSSALTYTATLLGGASSPFTIDVPTGSVAPSGQVTVVVTPKGIPQVSSTAPNAFGDTLRITTDVPGDVAHDVTLTQTAQGAVLGLSTSTVQFGDVQQGVEASAPLAVTNTGNVPAQVTLTPSPSSGFTVSPSTESTAPVGGQLDAQVKITPALGAANATLTVAVKAGTVVCSAPLPQVTLGATGVNGVFTLPTSTLSFGPTSCGATAGQKTFDVKNTGTGSFSWTAALGLGASSPYTLDVASGTLAAGATTTVTVTPKAIPSTSLLTNNLYGDTITITPTGIAGGTPKTVTLTQTAKGGIITASSTPISFGDVALGSQSAQILTVTNVGSMPVTVTASLTGGTPAAFLLATPGATSLAAAGGTYSPGPTFKPTVTGNGQTTTVTFAKGNADVLCQPLPSAVTLTGNGTNGALTLGSASVSFPTQNCGAAASSKLLNLKNTGTAPFNWNASVLGSTGFTVTPASGSIAVGANVDVTVKSPAFSNTFGSIAAVTDTLRITTNISGDAAHDVPLSATPTGAMLQITEANIAFGTVQATKSAGKPITVTNTGNVATTVTFTLGSANTALTFAPQNASVSSVSPINGTATFAPLTSGPLANTVSLTVPGGTPLCAALPTARNITGTAAQGIWGGAVAQESFALVCNAAVATQSFNLTNPSGGAPYDFTAAAGSGYSVSPTSGTVPVNGTVSITVTPPQNVTGVPGGLKNATLSITTDIPADAVHNVPLVGTITGASLRVLDGNGLDAPTITIPASFGIATGNAQLQNDGNQAFTSDYLVVPDPANPAPAIPLGVVIGGAAPAGGATSISYSWDPSLTPSSLVNYKYTVYFPSAVNAAGLCSARTSQVVTVMKNTT